MVYIFETMQVQTWIQVIITGSSWIVTTLSGSALLTPLITDETSTPENDGAYQNLQRRYVQTDSNKTVTI